MDGWRGDGSQMVCGLIEGRNSMKLSCRSNCGQVSRVCRRVQKSSENKIDLAGWRGFKYFLDLKPG